MNAKNLRHSLSVALTCWSLLVSTLPSLALAQTTNTKPMSAAECTGSAYQWNSELNRCMLKGEASAQREMFQQCDGLEDASQKSACYEQMRNQNLNSDAVNKCKAQHSGDIDALKECISSIDSSDDGMADKYKESGLSWLGLGIDAAITGLAVANMISKSGEKAKGCTSATMLKFTGIGATAGQLYLKLAAKGDFKKLEEEYQKKVDAGEDGQFAAYDYLEEQQNEIVSVAKKHETVYNITTMAYGATALVAGLELTVGSAVGLTPCTNAPEGDAAKGGEDATKAGGDTKADTTTDQTASNEPETDSSVETEEPSISDARKAELEQTISPADKEAGYYVADNGVIQKVETVNNEIVVTAKRLPPSAPATSPLDTATQTLAKTGIFSKISNFLSTSAGILTVATGGALINAFLKSKASSQKDKAKANAEKVAELRAKLQEALASSSYCPSRDDLSAPKCYCYKSDGSRNTDHSRSETCQALWANQDRNLFAEAGNYAGAAKDKAVGCYTTEKIWDPTCKCRQAKNDQGQNACLKVPVGVNQIAALGQASGIPNVIDSMNKLYGGGLGSGELQPAQIGSYAARVKRAQASVLPKVNAKLFPDGKSSIEAQAEGLLKTVAKSLSPSQLASARSSLGDSSGSTNLASNPALQAALEKSGIVLSNVKRGSGASNRRGSKKAAKGFDIYGSSAKNNSGAAYMEKKYNYDEAQNDIVEREDVSIWKVISNRYTVTGLKRLFDDDKEGL